MTANPPPAEGESTRELPREDARPGHDQYPWTPPPGALPEERDGNGLLWGCLGLAGLTVVGLVVALVLVLGRAGDLPWQGSDRGTSEPAAPQTPSQTAPPSEPTTPSPPSTPSASSAPSVPSVPGAERIEEQRKQAEERMREARKQLDEQQKQLDEQLREAQKRAEEAQKEAERRLEEQRRDATR